MLITPLLSTIHLFDSLPNDIKMKTAKSAKLNYYKKGTQIFSASQANKYFIYIVNGWIKLFKDIIDGSEVIIDILNDRSFFGENFIFDDDNQDYNVETISDVELLIIPIAFLRDLIEGYHSFSLALLKTILQKKQKLTLEVEHLSIKSAAQRIGCFLLRLCSLDQEHDITLKFPYDKSLLALRLGMRPETFSRALAKLSQDCNIQTEDNTLYIKHMNTLISHVCGYCSQTYPCKEVM